MFPISSSPLTHDYVVIHFITEISLRTETYPYNAVLTWGWDRVIV
jgi:hypothetical protein